MSKTNNKSIQRPAKIGKLRLRVTTTRYAISEPQVHDFINAYRDNDRMCARLDSESLLRTGKSKTMVVDLGMQVETCVELCPMSSSDYSKISVGH